MLTFVDMENVAPNNLQLMDKPESPHHVVYIWMSQGVSQVGHASMLLCNGTYISWWPENPKKQCGPLKKVGSCPQSDIEEEGFVPDYTFDIPTTNLNTKNMMECWRRWTDEGIYSLLERNCCYAVYYVLRGGGAPISFTVQWRPETLRRYLVIYLGGGSAFELFLNLPNSDDRYKESPHHVVYIWMFLGLSQVGHASMLLCNGTYISWWPQDPRKKCGPLKKVGSCKPNLQSDIKEERFEPDYTFYIPKKNLNTKNMMECWRRWTEEGVYSVFAQNCCHAVYYVLRGGGAPESLTRQWRPETLRRYLVIYLGGGSSLELSLNFPGLDNRYKEKQTLFIWRKRGGKADHASLLLQKNVYISWWPPSGSGHGTFGTSNEEDSEKIGRSHDKAIQFCPGHLDVSDMKRFWREELKEHVKELWGITSCGLIYMVLNTGEAIGSQNRCFGDNWDGDKLENYLHRRGFLP